MKTKIRYYLSALFLLVSIYGYSQTGIECVECHGMNGNHKTWCKYYNPPVRSSSSSSSRQSVEQQVLQGAFQGLLNSIFAPSTKQTEQDKLRVQQEAEERNKIAALRAAALKRYNDSIQQIQHDKMMKSYKTLDNGAKDLTFKGLNDVKPAWDPSVVVLNEQKMLDNNTQTWVEYQKEQFKIRLQQPNYWCKQYYKNLVRQDSLLKAHLDSEIPRIPSINLSEIQPGDVILIGPTDSWVSKTQAQEDAALNDNNANFTHTVTCVKVVNGKRFYLDNQLGEGPRIIDETTFKERYKNRDSEIAQMRGKGDNWGVAQPLNKEEAQKLWDKSMELNKKNRDNVKYNTDNPIPNYNQSKSNSNTVPEGNPYEAKFKVGTNYGLYGDDNMVCSEASWMLVNSTGRYQIPEIKSEIMSVAHVKFSPASFYNVQQYFLITPLNYNK